MLWKCCTWYASKFGNLRSGQRTGKCVFIPVPKKGNAEECSNYCTTVLIAHTSKVMLKILHTRLQEYMNREHPDVQAGFRKGRGTRDHIANICWIIEKENSRRTSTSALLTMPKPVWITINCGKFFKRNFWEICMEVKKQVRTGHGTMDWFQTGKEYVKAVYCHSAYLT